ncbi:Agmatinase (EC [Olavius algarvensis associated proteobacterium Delta 3]|nr:Agmatinase (EC [Olavius algarvensis associated proteobacterium Delta 3]
MTDKRSLHFGGVDVPDVGFEAARIVILPLPYERAPSYGTGSQEGPEYLLQASAQLERLDEETLIDWTTLGLHTRTPPFLSHDPQTAVDQIHTQARKVLETGKFLLSLGGDHAVSIGLVRAAAEIYENLGVLQIDAHADLRNEWNGSRFNHACAMRRVVEMVRGDVVPVGIRSFSPEDYEVMQHCGLHPVYAHEIDPLDDTWIDRVIDRLPETVYLTLDLDGLDPSVIPGTGTPEPGGLSYRQAVRLIQRLGRDRRVVASDITELAKIEGTQVSELAAAKLATKMMVNFAGSQVSEDTAVKPAAKAMVCRRNMF